MLSTPRHNTDQAGLIATEVLGQPHHIKSETTRLGTECENKARFMLGSMGYRTTDAGEGYEYDLLIHSHSGVSRIQVKALSLTGKNRIGRTSQKTSGWTAKAYGSDAFDALFLVSRDSFSGYLIPASELTRDGKIRSTVPHRQFSRFLISTQPNEDQTSD